MMRNFCRISCPANVSPDENPEEWVFEDWDALECPSGGGLGKWKAFSECVTEGEEDCTGDMECEREVGSICEELECANLDGEL